MLPPPLSAVLQPASAGQLSSFLSVRAGLATLDDEEPPINPVQYESDPLPTGFPVYYVVPELIVVRLAAVDLDLAVLLLSRFPATLPREIASAPSGLEPLLALYQSASSYLLKPLYHVAAEPAPDRLGQFLLILFLHQHYLDQTLAVADR